MAAVFSIVAGSVGMALGIAAWCYQNLGEDMPTVSPYESEEQLVNQVKSLLKRVAEKKGDSGQDSMFKRVWILLKPSSVLS